MDILAHGLWTNLAYFKKYQHHNKQRWLAVFFGVLPDLISFTPVTLYLFFRRSSFNFYDALHSNLWVYQWARESYNWTHSLVIFFIVAAIIYGARKGRIYWPIWGWGFHIALDVFTHKDFFQTPFLFPISGFKNHYAVRWSEPHFMFINYGALAMVYLFLFYFAKKRNAKTG